MKDSINRIRNKFIVLGIINIEEPVKEKKLREILKEEFTLKVINSTLRQLTQEGRIIRESDTYRLTRFGWKTVLPGEAGRLRDRHRMHCLYENWKNRGGVR